MILNRKYINIFIMTTIIVMLICTNIYASSVSISTFGGDIEHKPGFTLTVANLNAGDNVRVDTFKGDTLYKSFSLVAISGTNSQRFEFDEMLESQPLNFKTYINEVETNVQNQWIYKGSGIDDGLNGAKISATFNKHLYNTDEMLELSITLNGIEEGAHGPIKFEVYNGESILGKCDGVINGNVGTGKLSFRIFDSNINKVIIKAEWGQKGYKSEITIPVNMEAAPVVGEVIEPEVIGDLPDTSDHNILKIVLSFFISVFLLAYFRIRASKSI